MGKIRIYGERSEAPSVLEEENRRLAKEVAKEGFVLLENDGVLPLKHKKVSLFGAGARLTVKGGSGSGDVHERYSVTIEEGLLHNGFEIVNTAWLSRFSEDYEQIQREFEEKIEDAIKGYPVWKVMEMFQKIGEFKMAYPTGDLIRPADLSDETDTAIYVIARQAGEGDDRKCQKEDFLLNDTEIENLKICAAHYKNVIVVINVGGMLDLSPLDDIAIDAILYYGQAGEEGGNALGEILAGKTSPSGRLTDTWGKSYADYPTAHAHEQEGLEEDYTEGIYVGYRWFDEKKITPRYPFGYGLSYTDFSYERKEIGAEGVHIRMQVEVTNTGAYAGREVLQCYVRKPGKLYACEKQSLCAFAKTKTLKPGERQMLQMTFDMTDLAVYDQARASYVLEAGDYEIRLGKDAAHNEACALLRLAQTSQTEICRNEVVKQGDFAEEKGHIREDENGSGLPIVMLEPIQPKIHAYGYQLPEMTDQIRNHIDSLSEQELALFAMGGGYFTKTYNTVQGACGNTTSQLLDKGIPNIIMSDGPAGINILQKVAYTKGGQIRYIDELPKEWQYGWLKRLIPKCRFLFARPKDTKVYQYCTAWPNATLVAQTFDPDLVEQMGAGIGKEMLKMGITLWLAPALNIHRDPLCGRNFEYYSEDPLLSGIFAAAITKGVQSNRGVGVTIKHFACNNREKDRTKVSANLSERALREIYLKGFRIACKAKPWAIMSSYNRINGVYAANNRQLLIDILRCEWGYDGLVMSDWDGADPCPYKEVIKAGNNMIMPGRKDIYKKLCQAIASGSLTREDLIPGAVQALKVIFAAKTSQDFLREQKEKKA